MVKLRLALFQKLPETEIPYLRLTIQAFCESPMHIYLPQQTYYPGLL